MNRRQLLGRSCAVAGLILAGARQGVATPAPVIDWQQTPVRLLMVQRRGCVYCDRWNKEIGTGYAASAQGRAAPLLRIDIDGPWPDGLVLGSQPYVTPTFILVDHGNEIGRMPGYVGKRYFYPMLQDMLDQLPAAR